MTTHYDQYANTTFRRIKSTPEERNRVLKLFRGNPVHDNYEHETETTNDNRPQSSSGELASDAPASHLPGVR